MQLRTRNRRPVVLIALTAIVSAAPAALAQAPAIDCQTQLLGSSTGGDYFSVDLATGAGTPIATLPAGLATEIEFDLATDTLWAEEVNVLSDLHVIDSVTGASLSTVTHPPGALAGLEFVGDLLYGAFFPLPGMPSDLVIVDTNTGALNTVGATGFNQISGLAYDARSGVMYGITAGGAPADLLTIDLASGAATVVGPTGLDFIGGIEFGPDGNLYGGLTAAATTDGQFLVRIDTASGSATPIGSTGFNVSGLAACAEPQIAIPVVEIPTLSSAGLALMALVLLGTSLGMLRRRAAVSQA